MFEVGCMFLAMLLWECSGVCETRFYLRNIYIVAHRGEEIDSASDESNCFRRILISPRLLHQRGVGGHGGRIHYIQAYQSETNTLTNISYI